jgi:hypothetical protein
MNMEETKLYSWFLGPKAEKADMLVRLVPEALRYCVFWWRNFHPEDDIIITEKCNRTIKSMERLPALAEIDAHCCRSHAPATWDQAINSKKRSAPHHQRMDSSSPGWKFRYGQLTFIAAIVSRIT